MFKRLWPGPGVVQRLRDWMSELLVVAIGVLTLNIRRRRRAAAADAWTADNAQRARALLSEGDERS